MLGRRGARGTLAAVVALVATATGAWAVPGALDGTFGQGGVVAIGENGVDLALTTVATTTNGYVAAGARQGVRDVDVLVARVDRAGVLDSTFGSGGVATVPLDGDESAAAVAVAPDGGVIVGGTQSQDSGVSAFVLRLTPAGVLDSSFGDHGIVRFAPPVDPSSDSQVFTFFAGMHVADRITVAVFGFSFGSSGSFEDETALHRVNANGSPDATFGSAGEQPVDVPSGAFLNAMTSTADGFLLAGLDDRGIFVAAVDQSGATRTSFGDRGIARVAVPDQAFPSSVVVDPKGRIVVAAPSIGGDTFVGRLAASGATDATFGIDGIRSIEGQGYGILLGIDDTGRLLVLTGDALGDAPAAGALTLHRLLEDGRRDVSLGTDGRSAFSSFGPFNDIVSGIGVLDGQRVLLPATGRKTSGATQGLLAAIDASSTAQTPPAAAVARTAGEDRVATAIALSKQQFPSGGLTHVVLASAQGFADALVGIPFAKQVGGPLLLTGRADLDRRVATEVRRLLGSSGTVDVLGGTGALSDEVERDLRALGLTPVRHAGNDRYETAASVADAMTDASGTIVLATGRTFADALAGGAAAANAGGFVLLTAGRALPPATSSELDKWEGAPLVAIGGDAAAAAAHIDGVTKIVGHDRYETARLVAEHFFVTPPLVGVASGESFADALSGGAHAAANGGPLLLTPSTALHADAKDYLVSRVAFLERVALYGGTAALSSNVESAVRAAVQ